MMDYSTVPAPHMESAVRNWIEDGIPGGSFLEAIVANDLREATGQADDINIRLLREWIHWFTWEAPSNCWGSPEKALAWRNMHLERRESA